MKLAAEWEQCAPPDQPCRRSSTDPAPAGAAHQRINDIEVLRAVAIMCVLVQHSLWNLVFNVAWLGRLLRYAPLWCGVDLFFVVSGFVITRSLLPALRIAERPAAVLRRFWIRRAFRLWPAAWCWLAFMLFGSLIFRHPAFMGTPGLNVRGALAAMFAFANVRFGLHGFGVPYGPSFPYWSLSLEEQFYLFLPPMILLARRQLTPVLVLLLLVQLPLPHPRLYFFCRNDGLLWGVLLAASPALMRAAQVAIRHLASVRFGGAAVLLASLGAMTQLSPPFEQSPPYWLGGLAAVAAIPVWLAAADRDVFHTGPLQRPVLWLGSRSYALYLCHMPIYHCAFALARHSADLLFHMNIDIRSMLIGLPLLLAASEATYRLVETPFRALGTRLSRWPVGAWRRHLTSLPNAQLCEAGTEDSCRAAHTTAGARRRGSGAKPLVGEANK